VHMHTYMRRLVYAPSNKSRRESFWLWTNKSHLTAATQTQHRHNTLMATYRWSPPSHKTSNLISSYTVSLPRVSVLRWPAAAPSARRQSCADMRRQTRATTACGTVRSTGSLAVYTGSARVCNTHRQQQQQITPKPSDVRSEGTPT